jgi:hypothetical protein
MLSGRSDDCDLAPTMKIMEIVKRDLDVETPESLGGEQVCSVFVDEEVGGLRASARNNQVFQTEMTDGHPEIAS